MLEFALKKQKLHLENRICFPFFLFLALAIFIQRVTSFWHNAVGNTVKSNAIKATRHTHTWGKSLSLQKRCSVFIGCSLNSNYPPNFSTPSQISAPEVAPCFWASHKHITFLLTMFKKHFNIKSTTLAEEESFYFTSKNLCANVVHQKGLHGQNAPPEHGTSSDTARLLYGRHPRKERGVI